MRKTHFLLFSLAALLAAASVSCSTHLYDEDIYRQLIHYYSPVDSVDQRHEWQLTTNQSFRINANTGSNIQQAMILSEDPLTSSEAEVMNKTTVKSGGSVVLTVSVPMTKSTLYAALVDGSGNYYVTSFNTSVREVSFSNATVGKPSYTPSPQTFTYLFEENFPEPGDYDYNDLVLRIATERTGEKEVTVHVTIAAVGGDYQMVGGIRLIGYRYQDIDSIKTTTGETFNENVPQGSLYVFDKTDNLLKGRNNEAVMNLFVDAHWAMAFNVSADYGLFQRKKYNVSSSTGGDYQLRTTRTLSYVVYFNKSDGLNNFTLDSLDPFIVTVYSGTNWETHTDEYRAAQVMFEYPSSDVKDLPWALRVPSKDFYYPLEGIEIGFKKNGAMFGAYMTEGHSFGEWAENYMDCLDWYEHQYATSIYVWY